MRDQLIETSFPRLQLHEEQGQPLKISGIASQANLINGNGRLYPREVMAREVARISERLDQSNHVGTVDHPEGWSGPSVASLGLKFTALHMDGDLVRFDAQIIPTAVGRDLEAVIRAGVKIGISSRGYASSKAGEWEGQPCKIIQDDYELETFDAVVTPSVYNARITSFEQIAGALSRLTEPSGYSVLPDAGSNPEEIPMDDIAKQLELTRAYLKDGVADPVTVPVAEVAEEIDPVDTPVVEAIVVEDAVVEVPEVVADPVVAEPIVVETAVVADAADDVVLTELRAQAHEAIAAQTRAEGARDAAIAERDAAVEAARVATAENTGVLTAIAAIGVVIREMVDKGDWSKVAALADSATWLSYLNDRIDNVPSDYNAQAASADLQAVVQGLASRAATIEHALTVTDGDRYGRAIFADLIAECRTPADVDSALERVRYTTYRQATGQGPNDSIRGRFAVESAYTEEQQRLRELSNIRA